jgi:2-methylcitrate dehydratase PrpD
MPKFSEDGLSRRQLLGLAVTAAVGTLLRVEPLGARPANASPPEVSPVMEKLSAYMSDAGSRVLSGEVVEKTKQHILDTLAAMISGSQLPPGQAAIKFAAEYGGKEVATVVASRIVCDPIEAAMTNGVLAHSDETDDSNPASQSHPGCAVVPAALATGERFGISGSRFIRAVALGYDIGTRFTITLGGQQFESMTHWSTHSISPLFGATAAAGCAASLNGLQMRYLLGYAAHQCSGLGAWNRDTEHMQKAFHFGGMTARSGVTSALLVQAGWTGVADIFSGKDNFFDAYNPHADPAGLIEELGTRFEVTRTNIKKWPVGSPIQAVLDALDLMQKKHPFRAADVRHVSVRLGTDEAAIVNNREIAEICLQHLIAVMLMDKTVSFASVHDSGRIHDPATLSQRAKVELVPDDQLERLMPLRVAIVELTLVDGTALKERVDNVRGTVKNPMNTEEVIAKARDLMGPVLGKNQSSSLIDRVLRLDEVANVRELRPLLQRA